LWRTLPQKNAFAAVSGEVERRKALFSLPQENVLYFIEKFAPLLKPWQREVLRIVRNVEQYFYPQRQTKLMNEGCATYVHYRIMHRLYEEGKISVGNWLEFLDNHTAVVWQPTFRDQNYRGSFNPYALGFAMMKDIFRIAETPTEEDRRWFPDFAGKGDGMAVLRDAWTNYRDESFVSQFLSPTVIRDLRLFKVHDDSSLHHYEVTAIHNESGYRAVRSALSASYDVSRIDPAIDVVDVNMEGDRRLTLRYQVLDGKYLDNTATKNVLRHVAYLWGYDVVLNEVNVNGQVVRDHSVLLKEK
jgi:spore cortex formation protein SpoVR/YcgB (stage V sporulation)